MKHRRRFPLIVFLIILGAIESVVFVAVSMSRPGEIPINRDAITLQGADARIDSGAIDAYMIENLQRSGIPGAILAIVRNDRILHTAGYGHTISGVPVTAETPMPIASLTKSMTAASILKLVEEAAFSLDDPVKARLAEFGLADERVNEISVRHLMNHSSGLATATLPAGPDESLDSLAAMMDWLRNAKLASDPGETFAYCNENYHLLSRLAEQVSEQSLDQVLRDKVFSPLQMDSSRVFITLRDAQLVTGAGSTLVYGVPTTTEMPEGIAGGAGGVVSSANDLARWLLFNASGGLGPNGARVLPRDALSAAHTASAPGSNYGFGWRQDTLGDGTINVHHSGIARAFTAHQSYFPDSGYAYAFVLNGGHFFRVEAASFRYGLDAIMMGGTPVTGWPFSLFGMSLGFVADSLIGLLTAIIVTIGIVGSLRARNWAIRHTNSAPWRIFLGFTPYAGLILVVSFFPWILSVFNRGQPVEFSVIFSYWPVFVPLLLVALLAPAAILVSRTVFWFKRARF